MKLIIAIIQPGRLESVKQALAANGGNGPEQFLLSDNGSVYVSDHHGKLLDKADIVHKRIPACRPQYNGAVECGIKEFKNVDSRPVEIESRIIIYPIFYLILPEGSEILHIVEICQDVFYLLRGDFY